MSKITILLMEEILHQLKMETLPFLQQSFEKKNTISQLVRGISSVGQPFPRPWFDIVSSHQDVAQLIKACVGMGWNSWCPGEDGELPVPRCCSCVREH